jgi:hypothetical protein
MHQTVNTKRYKPETIIKNTIRIAREYLPVDSEGTIERG